MTINNGPERRRSERVDYPFEIWYKDRNKNNQGFKHAYGKNLSEHGLLFETYENFPQCTILEIRLELPASEEAKECFTPLEVTPIRLGGRREGACLPDRQGLLTGFNILVEVVRTEEIKHQWLYQIGVSFCKIDDDCRIFLKNYISNKLSPLRQPATSPSDEKDTVMNREVFSAT